MNWKVASLFSGIGGIEVGLSRHLGDAVLLCEKDEVAKRVLEARFPTVDLHEDVTRLRSLPSSIDLVTAGFPCQDLSQAGMTRGIAGTRSGLVSEVFRLIKKAKVKNVLLENVSFMLRLDGGRAMSVIVKALEDLGYSWAYRVLDSRAFGVPQRRERVFLFASKEIEPWKCLFERSENPAAANEYRGRACGFYWTEGKKGLGWAVDAVPTLKGGSTIGIPSSPAIWMPSGLIGTPDIRDAERMQGFEEDWTKEAEEFGRLGNRWKLVGNAVTVDAAAWVGKSIAAGERSVNADVLPLRKADSWPRAAYGSKKGCRFEVLASAWPRKPKSVPLAEFLRYPVKPLSHRAITGFIGRLQDGCIRYQDDFMKALLAHQAMMANSVSLPSRMVDVRS